jgi:predicted RNase H-like nuclease
MTKKSPIGLLVTILMTILGGLGGVVGAAYSFGSEKSKMVSRIETNERSINQVSSTLDNHLNKMEEALSKLSDLYNRNDTQLEVLKAVVSRLEAQNNH